MFHLSRNRWRHLARVVKMAGNPNQEFKKQMDIIAAFAFGMIQTENEILPGGTNNGLASWIKTLKDQSVHKNSVILSQWEISNALKADYNIIVDYSAVPKENKYLSTSGVAEQFAEYCKDNNIDIRSSNVSLVAHPDHFERCCVTMHAVGGFNITNTRNDIKPNWEQFGCDNDGYDPKSTQEWTRKKHIFAEHEAKQMQKWTNIQKLATVNDRSKL